MSCTVSEPSHVPACIRRSSAADPAGSVGVRRRVRGLPRRPRRLPPRWPGVSYVVVVVDTDVASAVLKGQLPVNLARRLAGQQLATTFVTAGELTQWTYLHRWGPQRRAGLRAFFASIVVLLCSFQAATVWAPSGARSKPTPGSAGVHDRSTTPGSPPGASPVIFRLPRSTSRTTRTSPSTKVSNSSTEDTFVECPVDRTTAHRRASETQDANRKPR